MLITGSGEKESLPGADENLFRDEGIILYLEDVRGRLTITMEEYLCGYLPLVIPVDYEPECLKAQAVLLRTEVIGELRRQVKQGSREVILRKDSYLTYDQMEEMWGSGYSEYQEKVRQAVSSTQGIYLTSEGLPIEACFFHVSAGTTRSAGEFLGQEYTYLSGVECPKDYLSPDYLSYAEYDKEKLEKLLGGSIIKLIRDEAGYVEWVDIASYETGENASFTGEWMRKKLGLSSPCFKIEEEGKKVIFQVKGVGHGFGMSQFSANEMALEGADYQTILSYFFQNITFDKYEQS